MHPENPYIKKKRELKLLKKEVKKRERAIEKYRKAMIYYLDKDADDEDKPIFE